MGLRRRVALVCFVGITLRHSCATHRVEDYLATWKPHDFNHHRFLHPNFRELASTWTEQRSMILDWAVEALEVAEHSLAKEARAILDAGWGRKDEIKEKATVLVDQSNPRESEPAVQTVKPGEIIRGVTDGNLWEISFDFGQDGRGSSGVDHLVFGRRVEGVDGWEVRSMATKGRKEGLGGVEYRLYGDQEFRDFVYQYWRVSKERFRSVRIVT